MYGYSPECIAIARLGNIWLWRSSEEMLFQMPRYVSLSKYWIIDYYHIQ